jgi:hypothetical protein
MNVQREVNVVHLFLWKAATVQEEVRSVIAQQTGVSTCSAWKICRDDLPLFPCRMQLTPPLSEDGIVRHSAFAREYRSQLEDSPGVLNVTLFSDEAHSKMDAYIATQEPPEEF